MKTNNKNIADLLFWFLDHKYICITHEAAFPKRIAHTTLYLYEWDKQDSTFWNKVKELSALCPITIFNEGSNS